MRLRVLSGCVVALAAWAAAPGAQTRTGQAPVFRGGAQLVEVDVIVTDPSGQIVHGLTAADFVVRDRNRPQSVETFAEVRRAAVSPDPLAALPAVVRRDVASNASSQAGRLVVVVLDDLHTWRGRTDVVKNIARTLVEQLGPQSSMALLQTGGEYGVEVTEDRAALLAGIEKFGGRRMVRRPNVECSPRIQRRSPEASDAPVEIGCDIQDFNADLTLYEALKDAARLLGTGDRRRKAFVLISENIAKELSGLFQTGVPPSRVPPDGSAYAAGGGAEALAAAPVSAMSRYDAGLQDMMEAMRRGGIATYAIDPRGEVSPGELLQECHPSFGFADDPCLGQRDGPTAWTSWVRTAQRGLQVLSEAAGGFAIVNSDDFTGGIGRIVADLDNYYLLGFYTPDTTTKGYRRLHVEVKDRPDLRLRYRRGYQLDARVEPPPASPTAALARLASGPLPGTALAMRLHAVPMPGSGRDARVAIATEIHMPRDAGGDAGRLLDEIRFGFYAVDMRGGKVKEQMGRGARLALSPRREGPLPDEITYEVTTEMTLAPGRYQLRASALSAKIDKGGSAYLTLEVPDFSRAALALTDLLLAYADGPRVPVARVAPPSPARAAAGMATAPPPVLPFDPTLDRVFASSDTLRLFTRVVQRTPAGVMATISALAADGRVLVTLEQPIPAGREANLDIRLPLAQLATGAYRLRVRVTDGQRQAEREVGIGIR